MIKKTLDFLRKKYNSTRRKQIISRSGFMPYYKGIKTNKQSFQGPEVVQIDITNNCNLNCVGCWCHSELMGNEKFSGKWKQQHIKLSILKKLLDDLEKIKVKEIQLAGSGEPSMHPDFIELIRYIKQKDMRLNLVTNFTLLTKEKIKKLVNLDVNYITVSLWAGSAKSYIKTHPNQTGKTFEKIKQNLKYLHSIKKPDNLPHVKIYNVISRLNYDGLSDMLDFALETKVDFIEFQVIDIVKGKTDRLALTKQNKNKIEKNLLEFKKRKNYFKELIGDSHLKYLHPQHKKEFMEFGRFFKNTLPKGFNLEFNKKRVICPHGIPSSEMKVDQWQKNAFLFKIEKCKKCMDKYNNKPFIVKQEFLNLLGYGSFHRRISSEKIEKAEYEINIVDTFPCYVGWTYARILVNGDIIPCCKAVKKPLGNIYENKFSEIWFSDTYNKFRYMAKTKKKNDLYFKEIECHKSCDNLGMNLETHRKVKEFKK